MVATLPTFLEVVLTSTLRVKKGPGRRLQSAKRQRFMELRAHGWSIRAAAREVGASRSAGNNWAGRDQRRAHQRDDRRRPRFE